MALLNLSPREFTALMGGHSLGKMHPKRTGFTGQWTRNPTRLSNDYFQTLLGTDWQTYTGETGRVQFKETGKDQLFMLKADLMLKADPELLAIAQEFAADNELFLEEF